MPRWHIKHARSSTNRPGRCGYHRSGFLTHNVRHISLKTRRALYTRAGVSCRHVCLLKRAHALRASSRARKQSPPCWHHRTFLVGKDYRKKHPAPVGFVCRARLAASSHLHPPLHWHRLAAALRQHSQVLVNGPQRVARPAWGRDIWTEQSVRLCRTPKFSNLTLLGTH